ncbi:uncharacterized protein LOC143869793 [Tasmannia lanceolata]|uniref:uncharacterized protein LOC143869793 n=1 Tax=Tasmannia lanceolata TaxID=3420 RepID=UPI0040638F83
MTMCKAFSAYLKKDASNWFNRLRPNSIESFHELGKEFVAHFINSRPRKKPADALLALWQGKDETLQKFIGRFRVELHQINEPNFDMVRTVLRHAIRDRDMKVALNVNPPRDLQELMATADRYINNEESFAIERELETTRGTEMRKDDSRSLPSHKHARHNDRQNRRAPNPQFDRVNYTPLNNTISNILYEIRDREPINWPERMRNSGKGKSSNKYCRFHQGHGHTTDNCYHLKNKIERLAGLGMIDRYLQNPSRNQQRPRSEVHLPDECHCSPNHHAESSRQRASDQEEAPKITRNIDTIYGGLAFGGPAYEGRALYAEQVNSIENPSKKSKTDPKYQCAYHLHRSRLWNHRSIA